MPDIKPGEASLNRESESVNGASPMAAVICGAVAAALGAAALLGWATDNRLLAGTHDDHIPMAPNTALAFIIFGLALGAVSLFRTNKAVGWISRLAAAFVSCFAALSLVQILLDQDWGIDSLIFSTSESIGKIPLGHPSPLTALAFLAIGIAFILSMPEVIARWRANLASALLITSGSMAMVVFLGYLYGTPVLYGGELTPVALPTSIAFIFLCAGMISRLGGQTSLWRSLASTSLRSRLMRVFLTLAFIVVIIEGWLMSVVIHGQTDINPALLSVLTAILILVVIGAAITWQARSIGDSIDLANEELRRAEESLLEERNRAQRYLDVARVMLVAIGLERKVTMINKKGCEILGYPEEEIVGRNWFDGFIPSGNRQQVMEVFDQIMAGELEPYEFYENPIVTSAGEERLMVWHNAAMRDERGRITGLLSSAEDITERRKAEDRLTASERRYRELFEDSRDMVFISTPDGRFVDVNPAGVEMLGYEAKEQLLAIDMGRDMYLIPSDRDAFANVIEAQGYVKDLEIAFKKRDGGSVDALVTATAVRDESGAVVAYRGIIRDVTEQKSLEQQLVEAQKMEAVGLLAGGIAHDFNNLLMVMLGNTELQLMKLAEDDPAREQLNTILESGQKAAGLVRQLLAFSRRQILNPAPLSLGTLVSDMERMLAGVLGEDIQLSIAVESGLDDIYADRATLEQVFLNLAFNARDAMPLGGTLKIEVDNVTLDEDFKNQHSEAGPGDYVRIAIEDTGQGMDDEMRQHIFEPFYSNKEFGTGLGLSIAYGIIRQHGGIIMVSSELGSGTRFEIFLPSGGHGHDAIASTGQPAVRERAAVTGGAEKILVAEDEESLRDLFRIFLEALGYSVSLARDGQEALELFRKLDGGVDLVILDSVMPRMSGPQAFEEMRKLRPGISGLFVTGYSEEISSKFVHEGSGVQILHKPLDSRELGFKVREILDAA